MPRRKDIKRIMIIGSGPIVISQACEFDYSGTQACKALKEEGFEVILVNSNPATIMTDPEMADKTYIEPLTPEVVAEIIERERPDALLPTLGGQTGLNIATKLVEMGVIDKFGVKLIGANYEAIKKAEDREEFKKAMERIGLEVPKSGLAYNMEEAREVVKEIGFPAIIRPSYTLGGTGGGIAYNIEEFEIIAKRGLQESLVSEILIEESVIGWKEFELEVMRDLKDNVVIVCPIENFDPMGIHTGDSITVAPTQTLTDKEYQMLRDAAIAVIREIGVETGGSNIQFAVNPENGRIVVIEMNPRVSRSSALASKATGFPIAKIAAKLSIGYTLDEIPNDITKKTPACFEPTIDYCVVKIPRFTFEKFPGVDDTLGISMKSVGEVMAIGRTFKEALQKGIRGLEVGRFGLGFDGKDKNFPEDRLYEMLSRPNPERIFWIKFAMERGMDVSKIAELTKIDPWFLENMKEIVDFGKKLMVFFESGKRIEDLPKDMFYEAKRMGFSDRQLSFLSGSTEEEVRRRRKELGINPTYKLVDTCAAEFEAYTPYFYSTYEVEDESRVTERKKVVILGAGPNRIGQGIEFDYCCVHAVFAAKELGYEAIMVNSNPETVSTDYDTSDKLYFEPITLEDVLNIVENEKPEGVIVQFGGQTPLNLAVPLMKAGVRILGTSPESIDRAEDRDKFKDLVNKLGINQPPNGAATSYEEAKKIAKEIGFPVLVRPSYVLGGRAMEIVYDEESLEKFMGMAVDVSPDAPVLIDKFLEDAVEVDVDAVADGERCVICGVMEHIEEAGIHSGDSACVIPPFSLSDEIVEEIKEITRKIAMELNVIGLINIQMAIKDGKIYVLEVNPRASRTVPFVSKATGIPWAKVATKVILGVSLKDQGITKEVVPDHFSVKESVFPFNRFPGVDISLGPEMKSTGEVMGIAMDFGAAFAKSQLGANQIFPSSGKVLISVSDRDKRKIIFIAKKLKELGFSIVSTPGTAKALKNSGLDVEVVYKVYEGRRPNTTDVIKNGEISLIINTPQGKAPKKDELSICSLAVQYNIPYITTISAAMAAVNGIEALKNSGLSVKPIQEYHREILERIRR